MTSRSDPWLDRWLPLIGERAGALPVLELGCGGGRDSAVLAEAGCKVVGIDLSYRAIVNASTRAPSGEFHCQDIQAPWPLARAGVVVASLSLHYFPWPETEALAARIHETLEPRGVMLCRLNSTNDHHFGASGHRRIDDNYYLVDGEPKRFFDEKDVGRLFARGWRTLGVGETTIDRYERPKSVWEVVLEKAGS